MSIIDTEKIRHLETLARLHVSDINREELVHEVSSIVAYIGQIEALDLGSVDNSTMIHSHKNVTRIDIHIPSDEPSHKIILDNAPDIDNDFIKVKQVIKK